MTAYTNLSDATLTTGKPITQSIARAWRDNPIAITEGSSGAPKIQTAALEQSSGAQAVTAACVRPGTNSRALVTTSAGSVAWGQIDKDMVDSSVSVVLDRAAGNNVTGSSEVTIYSYSVPANMLGTSRALRLTALMRHTAYSGDFNVTLRVKYGSTTFGMLSATLSGTGNSGQINLQSVLSAQGATNSQRAISIAHFTSAGSTGQSAAPVLRMSGHSAIAEDSTGALPLILTGQITIDVEITNIRVILELL